MEEYDSHSRLLIPDRNTYGSFYTEVRSNKDKSQSINFRIDSFVNIYLIDLS